jgi:GAF domain-containing protein
MNVTPEGHRLQTLSDYHLLDTPAEAALDNLTELATYICQTPIGLISLIDESRQWFKSRIGLEVTETPRNQAFCSHAIQQDDIMVVPDAKQDDRFTDNPLVTGTPYIRFYAGAPLRVDNGDKLGTLCVIDTVPRQLAPKQLQALGVLRDSVVTYLELRQSGLNLEGDHVIHRCAWCQKIRVQQEPELWQSAEQILRSNRSVTHGICTDCRTDLIND